ncbi:hypothetical protein QTP70_007406 [Hemibagrus guttatus]|uniref:Uncharacterized protein n=1 Tax=Hemibagrus guttatus TaxID=175788 RepID=A0AAE0VAN3_9TELE|nr:hypothetical protein QTP70_007406 [Hemibagrus guttatus]
MGERKDLSEFDKGQIVVARRLDRSISKTAALVGCSHPALDSLLALSRRTSLRAETRDSFRDIEKEKRLQSRTETQGEEMEK